ncbi:MAG: hypothetical protein GY935_18060 [Gammaproteobacteria bacterium]|nr:hypothetical protein [Gammaproteobacteria bacterium]
MSLSSAWLLQCGENLSIAVGDREMVELVQDQSSYPVPGSPKYCSSVLIWQESIVPIMDLALLHSGRGLDLLNSYLCLLNYQEAPSLPIQQLALRVSEAPERIQVDDAQFCELSPDLTTKLLKSVTLSCFSHHAKTVLILDIASLCSAEFRDLAAA